MRAAYEKEAAEGLPEPLEVSVPTEIFKSEVESWAQRIGVHAKEIHVRSMTRKWASCSSRGRLTFDTSLLAQPADFRATVIVHELLHLKIPNHGRVFNRLLEAYLWRHRAAAEEE